MFGLDPLLKVLVPDYAAGALLGKGGSCLTDILDENGGVVRLSKKGQFIFLYLLWVFGPTDLEVDHKEPSFARSSHSDFSLTAPDV